MKRKLLSLSLITLAIGFANAQNSKEELKEQFRSNNEKKNQAINSLQAKGKSTFILDNKDVITSVSPYEISVMTIEDIRGNSTSNIEYLQNGSINGLSINGENMEIAIYDGGKVLADHHEFRDISNPGQNRIIDMEAGEQDFHFHATAVSGFIAAEGRYSIANVPSGAKGVLPKAVVKHAGFADTSNGDVFTKILMNNEYISNHSYGVNNGWVDRTRNSGQTPGTLGYGYYFNVNSTLFTSPAQTMAGVYQSNDRAYDQIVSIDPKFTIVKSSGNYFNMGPGPNDPKFRWNGNGFIAFGENEAIPYANCFDGAYCIGNGSLAKNIIVVGAINIPNTNNFKIGSVSDIVHSSYSSAGPRKDGAIKPDVVAVGTQVIYPTYSSTNPTSLTLYSMGDGTSFSAPVVTGILGGLTQLKRHLTSDASFNFYADQSKAYLIHTTMEAGMYDGPDNIYGWGLVDAKKAAELVVAVHNGDEIGERNAKVSGTNYEKLVVARDNQEIKATISWIDPAAELSTMAFPAYLDDKTSKIVNDLDLRIIDTVTNEVYFPWKLNIDDVTGAALKGDNTVDNVEQISIPNPVAGRTYKVVVSNKGNLTGNQDYTLFVTGANATNLVTSDVATKSKISVYPTVATDFVNIKTDSKINKVEVYDLTGKLVTTTTKDKVDVSSLATGVYVINISTENGVTTKKIVKQ